MAYSAKNNVKVLISLLLCVFFSAGCIFFAALHKDSLTKPVLEQKTVIDKPTLAKFCNDGNIYIIDSGSLRLICMSPNGNINYTIEINVLEEYTKFFDCAADEAGNLYLYAMETEYDALLTKRDMISKYDRTGKFIKHIFIENSTGDLKENSHTVALFNSLNFNNGNLTFSRVRHSGADLYVYDSLKNELTSSTFSTGKNYYTIAQLAVNDLHNFIYTMRNGDIYEVKYGRQPVLRASFEYTLDSGGVIPWGLTYETKQMIPTGAILFYDMASGLIKRVSPDGTVKSLLSESFFDELKAQGELAEFAGFGVHKNQVAGAFGGLVWFFDGEVFRTYHDGILLSARERILIAASQIAFVLGILFAILSIFLLFSRLLGGRISLFIKQVMITVPLIAASFFIVYTVTFKSMLERLNDEVLNELRFAGLASARLIDGDALGTIKSTKDVDSDAYRNLQKTLNEIVDNNADAWNQRFYAAMFTGKHFELYLSNSADEVNPFRPSTLIEGEDYENLVTGNSFIFLVNVGSGLWGGADVPIFNSKNEIVGMFELGTDMISYNIANNEQGERIAGIAALICVIILLLMVALIGIIVNNLRTVSYVFKQIANGNYSARTTYRSRDELGTVSESLNTVASKLEDQITKIKKLNESTIRFVPVQFMEYLKVNDLTQLTLGTYIQRNITILFFDIRAFSINSELMSAKENFLFVNKILGITGPIIRKHHGFVDKYIGDAAMALFPDPHEAILAGIEIYRTVVLDKRTQVKTGGDGISIGIGVHTGSVMMGIIGEEERLSSTVISKNVNFASRLESLTKQTGSGMLASRDTINQIPEADIDFEFRFIGMIQPAGVNEITGAVDILDTLTAEARKKRLLTKKIFESGIRKFHTKDYKAAYVRFKKVLSIDPDDICAGNCLAETIEHIKNPKLAGIFTFSKK
ncbi:MAG: hypothetical protein Ta2F_01330 [Termitinemataceae bacterium]|nr:MAG: hypothetical protein Ta2F_01330 [Termitinemataceae bacterium]